MLIHFRPLRILSLFTLLVVGCGPTPSSDSGDSSKADSDAVSGSDRPKVALIMKSLANEFFSNMAEGAREHQAAHSETYDLVINGIKDERDLSRQVALVEEMVAAGADAIVIAPADSKALVPALRRAQSAGVIVVNIDNRLDAEVLQREGVQIPFVGPNNRTGAAKVAVRVTKRLEPGDGVLILEGIRTSFNAQQRLRGFEEALEKASIVILDSQSADWEMSRANQIASSMLSEHPKAKAILAANDNMALGAVAAARAAGRGDDLIIVGFDNISAVRDGIREGKILATADQYGDQLAVFGIETALKLLSQDVTTVEDRETPVDVVTAENLVSGAVDR